MIILGRVDFGRRSGSGRRNDGIIHEKRIAGETQFGFKPSVVLLR